MKTPYCRPVVFLACLGVVAGLRAGDVEPPASALSNGVPVSTMKSLEEIEPRTLITHLPYLITNSGSYYVTGPLTGTSNACGIEIAVGDVIIDLNGYTLTGISNSFDGVRVMVPCNGLTMRNGAIRGWAGYGIMATNAAHARVSAVNITGCGAGGLYAGRNALIEQCDVYGNGFSAPLMDPPADDGIQVGSYSTVKECRAYANRGAGIHSYSYSRVSDCTATDSGVADGVHLENYCTVKNCIAARNAVNGIKAGSMCRVAENTCGGNGLAGTNYGAGVLIVGQNSLIEGNNSCGNYYGYQSGSGTADGNMFIRNIASNNSNQYYFVAGDHYGEQSAPASGSFNISNPWANFMVD